VVRRERQRVDFTEVSAEVQVGQLFVVQPDPALSPRESLRSHVKDYFGGFMVRRENMPSLEAARGITRRLRAHWRKLPPAIIAMDEEGGMVSDTGHLTTPAPSAQALGVIDDPEVTQETWAGIGRKLRALGANVVFAPVLDVNSEAANPVIGTRSFGSTARLVSKHGIAALKGLKEAGVASCAKHFPGHGSTREDSHEVLPTVQGDRNLLMDRDLSPFIDAFEQEAPDMVMVAHCVYPGLGESKKPATVSRTILRDLLRGELGYKGLVITDAMEMKGISALMSPEQAAVESILAGADLLLYAYDRALADRAYQGVLEAVRRGAIPTDRLIESLERIFRLRKLIATRSWIPEEDAYDTLDFAEEQTFFEAALQAVTLEGNSGALTAAVSSEGPKLAVFPRAADAHRELRLDVVREQLEPLGFSVMDVGPEPTAEEISLAGGRASEAKVVLVGTASRGPMTEANRKLVAAVTGRDVVKVGVALLNPADADAMMAANCRMKTYGFGVPQLWAMTQKLLG